MSVRVSKIPIMAKTINISYKGESAVFGYKPIDRGVLYGKRRRVPFDGEGNECAKASLLEDGSLLIKSGMTAQDIVSSRKNVEMTTIDKNETVSNALKLMMENHFSQLPVTSDGRIVGSIFENKVMNLLLQSPDKKDVRIEEIMSAALPFVDITTPIETISKMVCGDYEAILAKDFKRDINYIITRSDIAELMVK